MKGIDIMTEFEIVQSYKEAKDKKSQIGILADLTMNSKREIEEILKKAGVLLQTGTLSNDITAKKERAKSTVWTDDMKVALIKWDADGIPVSEISERLGVDRHAVSNKLWAIKKRPGKADKSVPEAKAADDIYVKQLEGLLAEKTKECDDLKEEIEILKIKVDISDKEENLRINCARVAAVLKCLLENGIKDARAEDVISLAVDVLEE